MTRQDAIRKVAAMLRLAERAGTAAEAQTAAALAQDMMDKWQIEAAALEVAGEGFNAEADEEILDSSSAPGGELLGSKRLAVWLTSLAGAIARANGCFIYTTWRNGRRTVELVGRPSGAEATRYLFSYLAREIDRLAEEQGRGLGQVWRREFREGAVDELRKRLAEQHARTVAEVREQHANNSSALVVVERAIARVATYHAEAKAFAYAKHNLRAAGGGGYRQGDGGARAAGAQAARGIALGGGRSLGAGRRSLNSGK